PQLAAAAVSLSCFVLTASSFQSPSQSAEQTASITSKTELVQVPVVVRRGGKHVSGLTLLDFKLQQDGKDEPIALFQEVHSAPPVRVVTESGTFSNIR